MNGSDSDLENSWGLEPMPQFGNTGGNPAHGGGATAGSHYGGAASEILAPSPELLPGQHSYNVQSADFTPGGTQVPANGVDPILNRFTHPNLNTVSVEPLAPNDQLIYTRMNYLLEQLQASMRSGVQDAIAAAQENILEFADDILGDNITPDQDQQQQDQANSMAVDNTARVGQQQAMAAASAATTSAHLHQLGRHIQQDYNNNYGGSRQPYNVADIAARWDNAVSQAAIVLQRPLPSQAAAQRERQRAAQREQRRSGQRR